MGGLTPDNDSQTGLLLRRMTLLNIDPDQLKAADPLLFCELQGRCVLCQSKEQCAVELAHFAPGDWSQYCPNETMLMLLSNNRDDRRVDLARGTSRCLHPELIEGGLTTRERQVIRLVSEGLSNKEVGRQLGLSDGTIKIHLHHIYKKLGVSNRTTLTVLAISHM